MTSNSATYSLTQHEHQGQQFGLAALVSMWHPNYIAPEVLVDIVNGHSFVVDTWSSAAASPPTRASSSSRSSPQTANAPHLVRHCRACLLHPRHHPHFGVAEGEDCGADGACEEKEGHEGVSEQEQVKKCERENILSVGREGGEVEGAAREGGGEGQCPGSE